MVYVQAEVSAATGSPVAELKHGSFGAFGFACLPRSDVMMRAKGLQGCPKSTAVLLD